MANTVKNQFPAHDNGGRRSGEDRREFTYSHYTPERRSLKERRSGFDRRIKLYLEKITLDRRENFDNASLSPC
ncbi:MAG: hypothetical protein HKO79_03905 [Desulfobacterales bacterium]|nr:hypothetical protein [Deltaproteobacteria bacterium]NNL41613.1 hypothetical protein [Desulfobacterales bacterium]